jgi:hypothetical protein
VYTLILNNMCEEIMNETTIEDLRQQLWEFEGRPTQVLTAGSQYRVRDKEATAIASILEGAAIDYGLFPSVVENHPCLMAQPPGFCEGLQWLLMKGFENKDGSPLDPEDVASVVIEFIQYLQSRQVSTEIRATTNQELRAAIRNTRPQQEPSR